MITPIFQTQKPQTPIAGKVGRGAGFPANPQTVKRPVGQNIAPQSSQTQIPVSAQNGAYSIPANILAIKTPSGKTVKDFRVPVLLIQKDPELLDYILRSESMKDEERQYWFNLTEIMNREQVEKLRDILKRERQKLAEIDAKYGQPQIPVDPATAAKKADDLAKKRSEEQQLIKTRETFNKAQEAKEEANILAELEDIED